VLFGADSQCEELSEELADMGALLVHQVAAGCHSIVYEALNDRRKARINALQEIIQCFWDVKETEPFLYVLMNSLERTFHSAFVAVVLKEAMGEGADQVASGSKADELANLYRKSIAAEYFVHAPRGLGALRKPIRREWKGIHLLEMPLFHDQELIGVFGIAIGDESEIKEIIPFLHVMNALTLIKLFSLSISFLEQKSETPIGRASYRGQEHLTSRENEVLELILLGLSNMEIALKLFISAHTVKNHITKIYEKLNVSDRTQALAKMYRGIGNDSYAHPKKS
jgi:DNA-binding CsgD family transcriptional regulator